MCCKMFTTMAQPRHRPHAMAYRLCARLFPLSDAVASCHFPLSGQHVDVDAEVKPEPGVCNANRRCVSYRRVGRQWKEFCTDPTCRGRAVPDKDTPSDALQLACCLCSPPYAAVHWNCGKAFDPANVLSRWRMGKVHTWHPEAEWTAKVAF